MAENFRLWWWHYNFLQKYEFQDLCNDIRYSYSKFGINRPKQTKVIERKPKVDARPPSHPPAADFSITITRFSLKTWLKTTAWIRKTKHNRDMVPNLILLLILFKTHKSLLQCFCLKNKTMKIFFINCPALSAILVLFCHDCEIWRRFKLLLFSRYCCTSILN